MDPVVVDGAHVAGVLLGDAERALDVAGAAGGRGVDAELVGAPARRDGRVVASLVEENRAQVVWDICIMATVVFTSDVSECLHCFSRRKYP